MSPFALRDRTVRFFKKLNCRQASELVSLSLDTKLGFVQRVRLKAHLQICAACTNFVQQMSFLRKAVRKHPVLKDDERKDGR